MPALLKCEETGKLRHKTHESAKILIRKLKDKRLSIYPCHYCNDWHVGKRMTGKQPQ